ncbi:hypothetical protein AMTR_s00069p00045060 [Amborella trichopoda]|uniref:Uncharacterized protein n=1 Tax=Amborella trichopoda TaxID=13333 RepID=U5D9X4_AMBTC|nr:hypothetical protein AMTR_s00069p00045060 [Amborella trichopoda]
MCGKILGHQNLEEVLLVSESTADGQGSGTAQDIPRDETRNEVMSSTGGLFGDINTNPVENVQEVSASSTSSKSTKIPPPKKRRISSMGSQASCRLQVSKDDDSYDAITRVVAAVEKVATSAPAPVPPLASDFASTLYQTIDSKCIVGNYIKKT